MSDTPTDAILKEVDTRINELTHELDVLETGHAALTEMVAPSTVKRGRPKGVKNGQTSKPPKAKSTRGPGRPKGSKNKPKTLPNQTLEEVTPSSPDASELVETV